MRQTAKTPRKNRTITVDLHDKSTYFQLINDGKAFVEFVLAFLLSLGFQLKHKASCSGVSFMLDSHEDAYPVRERWHLSLEYLALRHQLEVLKRSAKRPRFNPADRCL